MIADLCVDASIAAKWAIVGEPFRQKARRLLRDARAGRKILIAPPLFEMEVDSIFQTRVVKGLATPAIADQSLAGIDAVGVVILTHPDMRQRAREIARQFRQRKVYDATYAALAELQGCEFWTAGQAFYTAVHAALPFVKYLPDYP
jgi:predicted nucleic acid-binding protein